MKTTIIILVTLLVGVALSYAICRGEINHQRERANALRRGEPEPKKRETSKVIIGVCLANGFAWVWCSYVLAYLGRVQIAESLSQVAVTEIIGVVLTYCAKSAVENLSKHNNWPDKSEPPDSEI